MKRIVVVTLGTIAGLLLIILTCIAFLRYGNWNYAKPLLNERIASSLDRQFAINGDLAIAWSADSTTDGWRRWVPVPHVSAQDVVIGNPKFWQNTAANNQFASVKTVMFSIDLSGLLDGKVKIPTLALDSPSLSLQRDVEGKDNWTFHTSDRPTSWKLELDRFAVNNGTVTLDDALRKIYVTSDIATSNDGGTDGYGLNWVARGSFNGEKLDASGKAGAALALQNQLSPYPLQASAHIGRTRIAVKGTLTKPSDLAALDLRLQLSSDSMADLYAISGITLPNTPAFDTEGHLIGKINSLGSDWVYENFKGRVGASDLSGNLEYRSQKRPDRRRPLLTGAVVSNLLQFSDLAPIIGSDAGSKNVEPDHRAIQPNDRVLPVQAFKFDRWRSIDADVNFSGKKIIRDKDLPIDNLVTHILLQDGVLSLAPLQFGVAGGKLVSDIKLNGNGAMIQGKLNTEIEHLQLNQLAPNFKPMQSSFGEINGHANLAVTGNSVASLLATSNGQVGMLIDQGKVSKLLLDEVGLNVVNVLFTKLFGDKMVSINCVGGDMTVTNGMAHFDNFFLDTDQIIANVNGQVDLANERLALTIKPENRKFQLVSLRAPIYVGGTFKDPNVGIDKGTVTLRAGGAIALGVLTPFAAILPLVDTGPGKDSPCASLSQHRQKKTE